MTDEMKTTADLTQASIDRALTNADRAELDWWRKSFVCRFPAGNLPRPGSRLLGRRYVLTELVNGELVQVKAR